ncbi:MAG: alpha/beta fold hydrolase [Gemmatimonadales bacterium]|jgi:2-succinyl-6-hydroxy-2,4-cyclohexadiene-1-carboxylate synthase
MASILLHCLHGTFQSSGVWAGLGERLAPHVGSPLRILAEEIEPLPTGGLPEWAESLCARMESGSGEGSVLDLRVLVGYSLGGRLALHALLACPAAWSGAVLIGAHPGEADERARAAVRARDAAWADRCRGGDATEDLLRDWDGLAVFGGHPNRAPRDPATLDRARWARAFEAFSRAGQADLRRTLAEADLPPILYLTGADDPRYPSIGDALAADVPGLRHETVVGAGHRVPWDRPEEFAARVGAFVSSLAGPRVGDG